MNSLYPSDYLPPFSSVSFLLGLLLLGLFYRWAWGLLIISNLQVSYAPLLNGDWITVFSHSIVTIAAVYGLIRWGSKHTQPPQDLTFGSTLDDLQHINASPPQAHLRPLTSKDLLHSVFVFIVTIAAHMAIYYYSGISFSNNYKLLVHFLLFSINVVGFFWLAEKIYEAWLLLSIIFGLRILYFFYVGFTPDFKMQLPLIVICAVYAMRWHDKYMRG